ncbi:MAG: NUDIX hydrolase [Gammaproteobacteria bacterium]|nr:NUDIX hydrolase [Gammaproteobacteria bacterium]
MLFCNLCGCKTIQKKPDDDHKLRDICTECGAIHYQNPKIITGSLIEHDDKILLCRRAIEPQAGKWTLPAGFMENKETCEQGAARETIEEANAKIVNMKLFAMYDIPHISQVYMIYRAQLAENDFSPGTESLEVKLFSRDEIPWELLAFSVIREILINYFNDQEKEYFQLHTGIITPEMKQLLNRRPTGF